MTPSRIGRLFVLTVVAIAATRAHTADPSAESIRDLKLKDWEPRSMMVTKTTIVEKPLFPVIDIHNHLGGGKATLTPDRVNRVVAATLGSGERRPLPRVAAKRRRLRC